jgi:hypothetical protein
MKKLLLSLIALSFAIHSNAQYSREAQASQDRLVGTKSWISPPFPMQGSRIVYEGTETVPSTLSKATLFKNALEWYNYNYKSGDTRLTIENEATGKISGTGVITYNPAAAGVVGTMPIFFEFELQIADGKYSYKFYDMHSVDATGKFLFADMYREDRNLSTQIKPRWTKRYRYEILSDMNTMIEMSIVHLKQTMLMNSGVANN